MALALKHRFGDDRAGIASSREAIEAGTVAGLVAGLAMALVWMSYSAWMGSGFFAPPRLIAAAFYGASAMDGGAGVVLIGILTHLAMSAICGLIFGIFVGRRWTLGNTFTVGIIWGAIIWVMVTWTVLPWADTTLENAVQQWPGWWFFYHMIYGGCLVLTPMLAAIFAGQPKDFGNPIDPPRPIG